MFLVLSTPRDMFAGCAIGCCSLRQVRENALLRGKFFALLQIAANRSSSETQGQLVGSIKCSW